MARNALVWIRKVLPRSRRLLGVSALGVTLAMGATVTTLASWTTHEYVWGGTGATGAQAGQPGGGITTSAFNVELSTDGATFADQSTSPGRQLSFSSSAGALSPGVTTYAWAALRTTSGSTVGGTVTLAGASLYPGTDASLFAALTYGAKSGVPLANCSAAGYPTASGAAQLVADGSALTATSSAGAITLAAPVTSGSAGAAAGVCFALTLPPGSSAALSGRTTTPVWNFNAVSN